MILSQQLFSEKQTLKSQKSTIKFRNFDNKDIVGFKLRTLTKINFTGVIIYIFLGVLF